MVEDVAERGLLLFKVERGLLTVEDVVERGLLMVEHGLLMVEDVAGQCVSVCVLKS